MSSSVTSNSPLSSRKFTSLIMHKKDEILISKTFYNSWSSSLEDEEEFLAFDPESEYVVMQITRQGSNVFFTGGNLLAFTYGLKGDHLIEFTYNLSNDFSFKIYNEKVVEINYKDRRNVVYVSSDSDDDDVFETKTWTKTLSILAASGSHSMLIPANIVRAMPKIMPGDDPKFIYLIDDDGQRYKCKILVYPRSVTERYIGEGWYDFCKVKKLKMGDTLKFTYNTNSSQELFVKILGS